MRVKNEAFLKAQMTDTNLSHNNLERDVYEERVSDRAGFWRTV